MLSAMTSPDLLKDPTLITKLISSRIGGGIPVKLEMGCGEHKTSPDSIGIDRRDLPTVDIVGDILEVLTAINPGTVDLIDSSHFLEHVTDLREVLAESCRVLKPGGDFLATVPHFSNSHYYSDPTHYQPFGLYTFDYFVQQSFTKRRVPQYDTPLPLSLIEVNFVFKSQRPFYLRHALKKLGNIFNLNDWTKELYEENWTWRIPAYEMRFKLKRL